jgi:hypothetical protein
MYYKKIEWLHAIRVLVQIPKQIPIRFHPLVLKEGKNDVARKRKTRIMFPEKLNCVQFGAFQPIGQLKCFPKIQLCPILNRCRFGSYGKLTAHQIVWEFACGFVLEFVRVSGPLGADYTSYFMCDFMCDLLQIADAIRCICDLVSEMDLLPFTSSMRYRIAICCAMWCATWNRTPNRICDLVQKKIESDSCRTLVGHSCR